MSSYTFRLDQFHITNTRARHNDTDVLALCFKVGEREFTYTKQLGDVNNGNHDVGFELPGLLIDDSRTPISLKYSLVNSGHDKAGVEAALKAIDNIGMAVGSALGLPQEASKAVRNSNLQYRPKTFHQTCRARSSAPMVRAGSSGPTSVPVPQFLHLSRSAARTRTWTCCAASHSLHVVRAPPYLRVCRFEPPHFGAGCRGLRSTAAKLTRQQKLCFVAPYRNLRGGYGRSRE